MAKIMRYFKFCIIACMLAFQVSARDSDFYKNVRFGRSGDVYIYGIPQVSQKRNYCVPACVSMITRYFDNKINQKKLAKLFSTSSKQGTVSSDIEDAFQTEAALQDFELKKIYSLTENEYTELMSLYESSSKHKRKKRKTKDAEASCVFDDIDPDLARKLFPTARPELTKMLYSVCQKYIYSGVPIMWAVSMNLDPAVKMKGGHMRIIVGFNEQNNKIKRILYRDPWGGSTKIKRIDIDDAVTMTVELYAIVPKNYQIGMRKEKPNTIRNTSKYPRPVKK